MGFETLRAARSNLELVTAFRQSPQAFLAALLDAGADREPVRVGPERVLLLTEPDDAWELLTAHHRHTSKGRGTVRARVLLGDGLLTGEGETHRRGRLRLQPAFTSAAVATGLPHFVAAARNLADRWNDGGEIDLGAAMSAIALDAAGRALFGADIREQATEIARALADLQGGFGLAMAPGGPVLLRSPLPAAVRMRHARRELGRLVVRVRTRPHGLNSPVIDLLESQPQLTSEQIGDEVMTLLLAGHETTAATLTWALAAIDAHPRVRAELESEWDQARPELPWTMGVLAETLRLWPPSWTFTRRVTVPITVGGRRIPAGCLCLVPPLLLHRDPRWWVNPDDFCPDRWLHRDSDGSVTFGGRIPGQTRGAYLPFGAGPRRCIGEQFAWTEAAAVLAELGRRWRIRIAQPPLIPGPPSMTLRPRAPVRAVPSACGRH